MNDYDYVVLFDENGQPYIAHSVLSRVRSGAQKVASSAKNVSERAHKYYDKIKDGAKTRYFYSLDELKAYYNNARNTAGRVKDSAKNAAKRAQASVEKAMGIDDRRTLEKARTDLDRKNREVERAELKAEKLASKNDSDAAERAAKDLKRLQTEQNDAANIARIAEMSYRNTPISKIENAVKSAKDVISKYAKEPLSATTFKSIGEDIKEWKNDKKQQKIERENSELLKAANNAANSVEGLPKNHIVYSTFTFDEASGSTKKLSDMLANRSNEIQELSQKYAQSTDPDERKRLKKRIDDDINYIYSYLHY